MQQHMRKDHPTKDFKCNICGKVRLIVYQKYSLLSMFITFVLISQDIHYRDLSAKTTVMFMRQAFTANRMHLSVLSVALPSAGIIQEMLFLRCAPGKKICLVTLNRHTMASSERQLGSLSARAAASSTPATASW